MTKWWGYLHSNGTIQVKKWFGDHEDYKGDCIGNSFVLHVVEPFEAETRAAAFNNIVTELSKTKHNTVQCVCGELNHD